MATSIAESLQIDCFLGTTEPYQQLGNKLKRLAVEIALKECMKAVDIKKVKPTIKEESVFRTSVSSAISFASIVDIKILMNQGPARLGTQKLAKDYIELQNTLDKILLSYVYRNPDIVNSSLKSSLRALRFSEILQKQVYELEGLRNSLLAEDDQRFNDERIPVYSTKSLRLEPDILTQEIIEDNFKLKYYKNEELQAIYSADKSIEDIQKKIDFYKRSKETENLCIRSIMQCYETKCSNLKFRLNKMTAKMEEDDSQMNDEINVKRSNLQHMRESYKSRVKLLEKYKLDIKNMIEKLKLIPLTVPSKLPVSKSFTEDFTKLIMARVEKRRQLSVSRLSKYSLFSFKF